ncbi:hypothetical protein [Legionella quinlivanii]|uniref:hypothetical protein n=1 Tax=Legionella quinlivanii TaxID=45073 RepID=UPI002243D1E1|nr:hypothetical protein [Legionella quinlivanii]MCW8450335.1 hypothetical protein [Legionella quinlivanii]
MPKAKSDKQIFCLETKLTALILKNPQTLPAVEKMSRTLADLLTRPVNREFIMTNDILTNQGINDLFSDTYFGTLGPALDYCPLQSDIMALIIDDLTTFPITNLPRIMHLHQFFSEKIFDFLPDRHVKHIVEKIENKHLSVSQRVAKKLSARPQDIDVCKKAIYKQIFQENFLIPRTRIKVNNQGKISRTTGIADPISCPTDFEVQEHANILGVFIPPPDSAWAEEISRLNQPFLAGPSGSTADSLLQALLIGNFNKEELKQYITAIFGFIGGGGFHTAHEIMSVAKIAGIEYQPGFYNHFLAEDFLNLEAVQDLIKEYPQFFSRTLSRSDSSVCSKYGFFSLAKEKVCQLGEKLLEKSLDVAADLTADCDSYFPKQYPNYWSAAPNQPVALTPNTTTNASCTLALPGASALLALP